MKNKLRSNIIILKESTSDKKLIGDSMRVTQLIKVPDNTLSKSNDEDRKMIKVGTSSKPFRVHRYKTQTSFNLHHEEV